MEILETKWNKDKILTSITALFYMSLKNTLAKTVADLGFPVGGVDLVGGAVDPRGSYVSKILHVKTKESGPPPRSANVKYVCYIKVWDRRGFILKSGFILRIRLSITMGNDDYSWNSLLQISTPYFSMTMLDKKNFKNKNASLRAVPVYRKHLGRAGAWNIFRNNFEEYATTNETDFMGSVTVSRFR